MPVNGSARRGESRWDSLRLFTPAFHSALPGMPLLPPGNRFPTKNELADYLEAYAYRFGLPMRLGRRADSLTRRDDHYLINAEDKRYLAEHVVVGTGAYHHPRIPKFATRLAPTIVQL